MFSMTPTAAREILAAAQRSDAAGMALRVAARRAEDGSVEYGMGFDEQRVDDALLDCDGLTVLVGSPSRDLLDATLLDLVETAPGHFDFVFLPAAEAGPPAPAAAAGGCGSGGCGRCGG
jgi:iron-sulfur cluster assembly protein